MKIKYVLIMFSLLLFSGCMQDDNIFVLSNPVNITANGSGTPNYITKWDGSNTLVDSSIFENNATDTIEIQGSDLLIDNGNVIKSGNYPLEFNSNITDSSTAKGFVFKTNNIVQNETSSIASFESGTGRLLTIRGEGLDSGTKRIFLDSSVSSSVTGSLILKSPGILGTVRFVSPFSATEFGVAPSIPAFTTNVGGAGSGARISFVSNNGFGDGYDLYMEGGSGRNGFSPSPSITNAQLGRDRGLDEATFKWKDILQMDNGRLYQGNFKDVNIHFNGSQWIFNNSNSSYSTQFITELTNFSGNVNIDGSNTTNSILRIGKNKNSSQAQILLENSSSCNNIKSGGICYSDSHLYLGNGKPHAVVTSAGTLLNTVNASNTLDEITIYNYSFEPEELHDDEVVKFNIMGAFSTAAASDLFFIKFKINNVTFHTINWTGGNVQDLGYRATYIGTIRTDGPNAEMIDYAEFMTGPSQYTRADSTPHIIDTTSPLNFSVTVEWLNAKPGNQFRANQGYLIFKH